MKKLLFLAALVLSAAALPARANLNVFACEPEWASLAREIGGDRVSVYAATTARQDPHHIEARPSLIARVRTADLVLCSGSDLEIGWLPLLLTQSGNARVQRGTPGYLEAAQLVARLEVPKSVDRAQGDVHPAGNPHIQFDPRNILKVADALTARMTELDRANAALYAARAADFTRRWDAAVLRWQQRGAALKDVPVVVHHKAFSYLIAWLGMREVGSLEPLPGIPPSTAHLAELVDQMKRAPARMILYSSYDDPRAAQFLSQHSGPPAVMLPFTVGGSDKAKDLFGFFDDLLDRLLAAGK
ncbi:MAG TPA: zinc ABC transporter substrate-binding protein [Burkholderiales bacterium]|jgi:zinc/manganese transport system substrate-binding protein|nr:zinc ABC transporter substrate-binding protein [Burkholderiales bacterium]